MKNFKNNQGYAAIIAVMIIGTVSLIFSSFILFDGIQRLQLSLGGIHYEAAKYSATACLEDTLIRMKKNETFTQSLNYSLDADHTCQTSISYGAEIPGNPPYYPVTLGVTGRSFGVQRIFEYQLRVDNYDVYLNTGEQYRMHNIDVLSIIEST